MSEHTDWERRVAAFWESADDEHPEALLTELRALVEERGADSPEGLFELASGYDLLGEEERAVPLYRAALDAGLAEPRRGYGIVQLASSLRNVGEPEEAVRLLTTELPEEGAEADGTPADVAPAARAFLALALHDAGRPTEALRVALQALVPHVGGYGRALEYYATVLGAGDDEDAGD